jgi:Ca-activated chloride channel family protein
VTSFASPLWFLLFVAIAARVVLGFVDRRRGYGAFDYSAIALVGRNRSVRSLFAWLPLALFLSGLALVAIALARPQRVISFNDERKGIDIVIALDSSGSMAAEDFRPKNRFTVAKEMIADFVAGRENDRIGLVTFGARAATRVPVTFDRAIATAVLERAEVGENGDGTAIGQGIATSVNRLRNSKARSRVIILLTDGVNNAGSIEPLAAAKIAAKLGIKVYTIGVGSQGTVPVPVKTQNPITGEIETVYQYIRADLDEKMLATIAQETGAAYFRATDTKALQAVFARIDQLEKSNLAAPKTKNVEELYERPLMIGLLLLALATLFGETIWFRLPA